MHDLALFGDLLILVAIAIPAVAVAERLGISAIVAFLLTGMAIGPHGFAFIGKPDEVALLAELGAVLLLFEIGLEQSLVRIVSLRYVALMGGVLQVTITIGAVTLIGITCAFREGGERDVPALGSEGRSLVLAMLRERAVRFGSNPGSRPPRDVDVERRGGLRRAS